MKICVFSDIHGNGPAWRAALPMLIGESADRYYFLGDLCGYYYDQLEIYQTLVSIPGLIPLAGNHDLAYLRFLREGPSMEYREKYGSSADRLMEAAGEKFNGWLSGLKANYRNEDESVICCHGSPNDPENGYVYPDTPLEGLIPAGYRFAFWGHTHYRMVRSLGETLVVNPGSIGQPRDGWPGSYAVVDTESGKAEFRYVEYDPDETKQSVDLAGDRLPYLKDILDRPDWDRVKRNGNNG